MSRSIFTAATSPLALLGLSALIPLSAASAATPVSAAAAGAGTPALSASMAAAQAEARALVPVRGTLNRRIDPAPAGADALRLSVCGDGSGGRLQIRLLAPGEDGALTGYFAAPDTVLDFSGWKTLVLPLSSFTFHSDNNPELTRDGLGTPDTLANAAGLQISVLSAATKVFVDDLGWTKADAAPTDAPLAVIDTFDDADSLANWKPVGDFNERRTVDFSVSKVAPYVKSGAGALMMVVRSRGQTEQQLYEPTLRAHLKKTPTLPYVVYARQPFETITADSTPAPVELRAPAAMSLFAAPGQAEPTTFAVYSALPISGAKATVKVPLTAVKGKGKPGTSLPTSAIEIHVVHNAGAYENAPQVLMKDDREPLTGPLAKVRLTGDPVTDIPAGTSKQFWVTVRVPKNQTPGTYSGKIAFYGPGIKPTLVPITVDVLPLELRTAHFQYGIDLPSVLQPSDGGAAADPAADPAERVVTPEVFASEIDDIRDHGFKVITLHGKPSALADELKIYKTEGVSLAGPVVIATPMAGSDDFTAVEGLKSSVGLGPTFEMYYRLPATVAHDSDAAQKYATEARQINRNALVVAPVDAGETYGELSKELGDALAPIYALSSDYAQKVLTEGRRFTPNRDWWSWNISDESPTRNRLLAGFLLLKTGNGLYGAYPGPYQFVPEGADPYSLLSVPPPDAGGAPDKGPRPQLAAIPVEGGVLDTLQWEAVREGIDDVRYADLLKTLSREIKDLKIRKDATDHAESYLLGVLGRPLLAQTPHEQQLYRRGLADECLKLQAILAKAPKAAGAN